MYEGNKKTRSMTEATKISNFAWDMQWCVVEPLRSAKSAASLMKLPASRAPFQYPIKILS